MERPRAPPFPGVGEAPGADGQGLFRNPKTWRVFLLVVLGFYLSASLDRSGSFDVLLIVGAQQIWSGWE